MWGLSTTAIGHRPLEEALSIYQTLLAPLSLNYLELAIGTDNQIGSQYPEPLVLHDSCLREGPKRLVLSLNNPKGWKVYKEFVDNHKVLQVHIHGPAKSDLEENKIENQFYKLQDYLQLPLGLEIMPSPKYHASDPNNLPNVPLVLDISHINIWAEGDEKLAKEYAYRLVEKSITLHLSHNDGVIDSHDLIPENHWTLELAKENESTKFITYESLPHKYYKYERKDRCRKAILSTPLRSKKLINNPSLM